MAEKKIKYSEKELRALFANLNASATATRVDLPNCDVIDDYLEPLAKNRSLTALCLDDNRITSYGVEFIASLTSLRELRLRRNLIGKKGALLISKLPQISVLDLADNPLMPDGAAAVAKMPNLLILHLSEFHFGNTGAEFIVRNRRLRELSLGGSGAGDEIAALLAQSSSLKKLDLSGCCLDDATAEILAQNRILAELDLSRNSFGENAAFALSHNGSFTHLTLTVFAANASRIFRDNLIRNLNLLSFSLSSPNETMTDGAVKMQRHLAVIQQHCKNNRQIAEQLFSLIKNKQPVRSIDIGLRQNAILDAVQRKLKIARDSPIWEEWRQRIAKLSSGIEPQGYIPRTISKKSFWERLFGT